MSVENSFRELMNQDLQNLNTEVIRLLAERDKNLAMKTEIQNPDFLAYYKACSIYLKNKGLKNSSDILKSIIDYYLLYQVSKARKGRLEIIEALKTVRDALQTKTSKWLGRGNE